MGAGRVKMGTRNDKEVKRKCIFAEGVLFSLRLEWKIEGKIYEINWKGYQGKPNKIKVKD